MQYQMGRAVRSVEVPDNKDALIGFRQNTFNMAYHFMSEEKITPRILIASVFGNVSPSNVRFYRVRLQASLGDDIHHVTLHEI